MAVFSINSLRDRFDLLSFFKQEKNLKHQAEADVVLDIAKFDQKLTLNGKELISKNKPTVLDPRMGLGVWGEAKHLNWEKVLSSDTYYRDYVKSSYDEIDKPAKSKSV
jgi:hypothetical protein